MRPNHPHPHRSYPRDRIALAPLRAPVGFSGLHAARTPRLRGVRHAETSPVCRSTYLLRMQSHWGSPRTGTGALWLTDAPRLPRACPCSYERSRTRLRVRRGGEMTLVRAHVRHDSGARLAAAAATRQQQQSSTKTSRRAGGARSAIQTQHSAAVLLFGLLFLLSNDHQSVGSQPQPARRGGRARRPCAPAVRAGRARQLCAPAVRASRARPQPSLANKPFMCRALSRMRALLALSLFLSHARWLALSLACALAGSLSLACASSRSLACAGSLARSLAIAHFRGPARALLRLRTFEGLRARERDVAGDEPGRGALATTACGPRRARPT
jgi:hypothetical protein